MRRAEFRDRLVLALEPMEPEQAAERLGNSMLAHESAVTAVHLARRFDAFLPMVEFAVRVGGDVDTIAAKAGAIFGAQHGVRALPADLLARLEDRAGIEQAARDLHAAWLGRCRVAPA
jgi:poly(ADP-ribose) glycohydrolase ARH3